MRTQARSITATLEVPKKDDRSSISTFEVPKLCDRSHNSGVFVASFPKIERFRNFGNCRKIESLNCPQLRPF